LFVKERREIVDGFPAFAMFFNTCFLQFVLRIVKHSPRSQWIAWVELGWVEITHLQIESAFHVTMGVLGKADAAWFGDCF
jgi:hypothetical protein